MSEITVNLPHCKYSVLIESGIIAKAGQQLLASLGLSDMKDIKVAIIADEQVFNLHGDPLITSLKNQSDGVYAFSQVEGEKQKTLERVRSYYDQLLSAGFDRSSCVISFGGGVVGDTAGFVASSYFRGISFIQCPTSLLAMVDASVGGKVGVNLPQGKNLIGAFHQPRLVLIDPLVLDTLPERELKSGLAECIKHAVIQDPELFSWTKKNIKSFLKRDPKFLSELIAKNVEVKARVVEQDEKEQGIRAHLNFGHTFAHAIEATLGFEKIKHGEAVGLGMLAASTLANKRGLCDASVRTDIYEILELAGLPTRADLVSNKELIESMKKDKKARAGKMRLILPTKIGEVGVFEDVPENELIPAWDSIR